MIKDKTLLAIIVGGIILAVVIFFIAYSNLKERTESCNQLNGIIVKTPEGWTCIDSKVLQKPTIKFSY